MIGERLARALERHPVRPLLLALLVTLVLVPGIARLSLGGNLLDLLPAGAGAARELDGFVRTFGRSDPLTLLVEGGSVDEMSAFLDRFEKTARAVPNVLSVHVRLGHGPELDPHEILRRLEPRGIREFRSRISDDGISLALRRARALLTQPGGGAFSALVQSDPLELRDLLVPAWSRLSAGLSVDPGSGAFLAPNGRAALGLVRTRVSPFSGNEAKTLLRNLDAAKRRARPGHLRAEWTGAHAVAVATQVMIKSDLQRSSVFSVLGVLVVFALAFGRVRALFTVGPALLLGALWTAGFAGWFLGSLNAISVAFAAVLVGLGDDLATHLYLGILEQRRQGLSPKAASSAALRVLARPTVIAATTGAVGFFALTRSDFPALRDLGILSAVGLLLTALAVVLVVPALSVRSSFSFGKLGWLERVLGAWGGFVGRRYRWILLAAGLSVAGLSLLGFPRFARTMVAVRPAALAPLRVQDRVFEHFGGQPGQIVALVSAKELETALRRNDALARTLEALEAQGHAAGYSSLSALYPSRQTADQRFKEAAPRGLGEVADRLEVHLQRSGFRVARFAPALQKLRSSPSPYLGPDPRGEEHRLFLERHLRIERSRVVVATFARPAANFGPERLAAALRGRAPGVRVTGYPLVEAEVRRMLPMDLAWVSLWALSAIAVTLVIQLRGVRRGAAAIVGVLVGLAWLFAWMRLLGMEWTVYSLLILPVLVGIAVDEGIFLAHGWSAASGSPSDRLGRMFAHSGRAVLTTALTTAFGFGALVLCDFDGLRSLGGTAALGVFACLASTLVVTPALLAALGRSASASD